MTVVNVVEQIGVALGDDFTPYVCELIPYLLTIIQTDRESERKITERVGFFYLITIFLRYLPVSKRFLRVYQLIYN